MMRNGGEERRQRWRTPLEMLDQFCKLKLDDFTLFERHGLLSTRRSTETQFAEDLAGLINPKDLLPAIFCDEGRLNQTGSQKIDGTARVTLTIHKFASLDADPWPTRQARA
jgi:hypothetical protein